MHVENLTSTIPVGRGNIYRSRHSLARRKHNLAGMDDDCPTGRHRPGFAPVAVEERPLPVSTVIATLFRVARLQLWNTIAVNLECHGTPGWSVVSDGEGEGGMRRVERLHIGVMLAQVVGRVGIIVPEQLYLQAVVSRHRGCAPIDVSKGR